jgi:signal transduction histidine kinase
VTTVERAALAGDEPPLLSRVARDAFLRNAALATVVLLIMAEAAAYAWMRGEIPLVGPNSLRHLTSASLNVTRTLLFAIVGLFLADRYPATHGGARNILIAVTLSIAAALVVHLAITQVVLCSFPAIRGCPDLPTHLHLISLVAPASFVATGYAVQLSREYLRRERETDQMRVGLVEAQVANLTTQLRPHFLFNTLNSVGVLIEKDRAAADLVLGRLTDLLEASLHSTAFIVPLRDEIELIKAYAAIEQVRFHDRLRFEFAFDDDVLDCPVPHLLLQPLVENAVRHGISAMPGPGWIRVGGRREGDRLVVTIVDSGPGIPEDDAWMGVGLGITNTIARLERLYGAEYGFSLTSPDGAHTTVTLTLPARAAGGD